MVERQDAQEDSEAGPSPATQAYREETLTPKPHQLLDMQVVLLEHFMAINLLVMKMPKGGIRSNMNSKK